MSAVHQACILLSGGMDSVAALYWAKPRYRKLVAFLFDWALSALSALELQRPIAWPA